MEAVSLTSDRDDPRLGHGPDTEAGPQNEAYLILSDEERAQGFVRPVRRSYRHVGIAAPRYPLRDLTEDERETYAGAGYVKYEEYPAGQLALGRFWTQADLDRANKACGDTTRMAEAIAETYARQPAFYGATYCCTCQMHLPVGAQGEFVWLNPDGSDSGERVGT